MYGLCNEKNFQSLQCSIQGKKGGMITLKLINKISKLKKIKFSDSKISI